MVYIVLVRKVSGGEWSYETTADSTKLAKKNALVRHAREQLSMTPTRFFGKRWRRGKKVRLSDQYQTVIA